MKNFLSSKPVLWFLFLFNLAVAAVAPFVVDGTQGVMTAVGMGVVSLGAACQSRPGPWSGGHSALIGSALPHPCTSAARALTGRTRGWSHPKRQQYHWS